MKNEHETLAEKGSDIESLFEALELTSRKVDYIVISKVKAIGHAPRAILNKLSDLNPFADREPADKEESKLETSARRADSIAIDSTRAVISLPGKVLSAVWSLNPFASKEAEETEEVETSEGETSAKQGESCLTRGKNLIVSAAGSLARFPGKVADVVHRLNPLAPDDDEVFDDLPAEAIPETAGPKLLQKKIEKLEREIEAKSSQMQGLTESGPQTEQEALDRQNEEISDKVHLIAALQKKTAKLEREIEEKKNETIEQKLQAKHEAVKECEAEINRKRELVAQLQKKLEEKKAGVVQDQAKLSQRKETSQPTDPSASSRTTEETGSASASSDEADCPISGEAETSTENIRFKNKSEKVIFLKAIKDLSDTNDDVKVQAAEKLGELGKPEAGPFLVDALVANQAGSREVLEKISDSLITLNDPSSCDRLATLMVRSSAQMKLVILSVLSHGKSTRTHEAIVLAMHDKNKNVQRRAITIAGWKNLENGLPIINVFFETNREAIEQCCLETLNNISKSAVVNELLKRLQSDDEEVLLKADRALRFMTGKNFDMDKATTRHERSTVVREWLMWWEETREKKPA